MWMNIEILPSTRELGSAFHSALTPPAEAKSHNDSASTDCWTLPSFFLCLYLNSPLSGIVAARICQQQVGLLSWQSRGDGVLAKGRMARLCFAAIHPRPRWAKPSQAKAERLRPRPGCLHISAESDMLLWGKKKRRCAAAEQCSRKRGCLV